MEPASDRDWPNLIGHGIVLLACIVWAKTVLGPSIPGLPPWIALDYANLVFHEGGHAVFSLFGQFIYILGGSLGQLLVPLICLIGFWRQNSRFSVGFCIYWLGESAMNLGYYIADARAQLLQLISNDSIHDWNWLLSQTHLLPYDHALGGIVHVAGYCAVLIGMVAMGRSLWQEFRFGPTENGISV